jgi:diguanylate cyclase (GGDEF)-like protein
MTEQDLRAEVAALRAEVQVLRRQAMTDGLTGLLNRRAFYARLGAEYRRAARYSRPLALVLFDLDGFKALNDERGHLIGDRALRVLAGAFGEHARAGDALARLGGDEFAVIAPDTDAAAAVQLGERLGAAGAEALVAAALPVTLSAGVAELSVAQTVDELIHCADDALYGAKHRGGNQVVRFTAGGVSDLSFERALSDRVLSAARSINAAVAAKDCAAREHAEAVARVAGCIAARLGWDVGRRARLREAALLHDVGKLAVPEAVLRKHGALTEEEYEQIKDHPALGARIVEGLLDGEQIAWVRAHHERPDGQGYPNGLVGEEIPDGARIIAVADAYDAITREGINAEVSSAADAIAELRRSADTQFDAAAVNAIADWAMNNGQLQPSPRAMTPTQADADKPEGPPAARCGPAGLHNGPRKHAICRSFIHNGVSGRSLWKPGRASVTLRHVCGPLVAVKLEAGADAGLQVGVGEAGGQRVLR